MYILHYTLFAFKNNNSRVAEDQRLGVQIGPPGNARPISVWNDGGIILTVTSESSHSRRSDRHTAVPLASFEVSTGVQLYRLVIECSMIGH